VEAGAVGVSLADLQELRAKEVQHIPMNFLELEMTLGLFGNLMDVVLGPDHPLIQEYKLHLIHNIDQCHRYSPIHIMRRLQLEIHHWFAYCHLNQEPAASMSMVQILIEIEHSAFVLPNLPRALIGMTLAPMQEGNPMAMAKPEGEGESGKCKADTRIMNLRGPDAKLQKLLDGKWIRDVIKMPAPGNSDGVAMCVSYHALGSCYKNFQ